MVHRQRLVIGLAGIDGESVAAGWRALVEQCVQRRDAAKDQMIEIGEMRIAITPARRIVAIAGLQAGYCATESSRHDVSLGFDRRRAYVVPPDIVRLAGQRDHGLGVGVAKAPQITVHQFLPASGFQLVAQRAARQFLEKLLVDQRLGAVRVHAAVPGQQHVQRGLGRAVQRDAVQQRDDAVARDRMRIGLHGRDVVHAQLVLAGQQSGDAFGTVRSGIVSAEQVRVIGGHDAVVGRRQIADIRVDGEGHLVVGDRADPLVLAGPAWHGRPAVAGSADGRASGALHGDVARRIGDDKILRP